MEEKTTPKKRSNKFLLVLLLIFIIFVIPYLYTSHKDDENKAQILEKSKVSQSDTLDQRLQKYIKPLVGDNSDYSVSYDNQSKQVTIEINKNLKYEDSDGKPQNLVQVTQNLFVSYALKAFSEDITNIKLIRYDSFIDNMGNKNTQEAITIDISKEKFTKYNWKNFSDSTISIYPQLKDSSRQYYIQPSILKDVDTSQLFLTLQDKSS